MGIVALSAVSAVVVGLLAIMATIVAAIERRSGRSLVAQMRMWDPEPAVVVPVELRRSA